MQSAIEEQVAAAVRKYQDETNRACEMVVAHIQRADAAARAIAKEICNNHCRLVAKVRIPRTYLHGTEV
jgi:hypothetical protein